MYMEKLAVGPEVMLLREGVESDAREAFLTTSVLSSVVPATLNSAWCSSSVFLQVLPHSVSLNYSVRRNLLAVAEAKRKALR